MLYNESIKQLMKDMIKEYGKQTRLLDVVEEFKKRAERQNIA